jgi:signal transduction histidine kinase
MEFEECDFEMLVREVVEDLSFAYGERFIVVSDSDIRAYCSRKEILFQQFRRTISAEEQTGWGLGLFLAKNITEAHKGTLAVESAEGKGTSFIINLPKVIL